MIGIRTPFNHKLKIYCSRKNKMKVALDDLQIIKRQNGIYSLKKDNVVVYIGRSSNVYLRILEHIVDNKKDFDTVHAIYEDDKTLTEVLEMFIIDTLTPKYNKLVIAKKDFYNSLPFICKTHSSIKDYMSAIYTTDIAIGKLQHGN